jgi:hypothetical protein
MELPNFNTYINFYHHHFCCIIVAPWFVLNKSMACNRCLQNTCFKNLCKIAEAFKNSDSNAQHFLSDLQTHSWFLSMLFALPGYQFPYTVMNRCFYLWSAIGFTTEQELSRVAHSLGSTGAGSPPPPPGRSRHSSLRLTSKPLLHASRWLWDPHGRSTRFTPFLWPSLSASPRTR